MKKEKKNYKKIFFIIIFFLLCITFEFGYIKNIGTKKLQVKEYSLSSKMIPESFDSLKIIHLSDIHYGSTIQKKELEEIVKQINYIKPDIVVLSGDLLHKSQKVKEEEITNILSKIDANIGKYAVSGDEDLKNPLWPNIIENSGFIHIDDRYELIYKDSYEPIVISGISSNLVNKNNIEDKMSSTTDYLSKNENLYSILVLHEPDYIQNFSTENYDVILSGHSHNGYINLPFIQPFFLEEGSSKYYQPHYSLDHTELFISSGLGTSSFNYRFNNRPSFNFYRLYKEKE